MIRDNIPSAVEGAAAIMTMLNMIGAGDVPDSKVMKRFGQIRPRSNR